MRLTKAGDYAIRCGLYLSGRGQGVLTPRREVAQRMGIPEQYLGKIAQQLARAGLIQILQGARGGLRLAVPPDELSLLIVLEAVIGKIFLSDCVAQPSCCDRSGRCPVHPVWLAARDRLRRQLDDIDFETLAREELDRMPLC